MGAILTITGIVVNFIGLNSNDYDLLNMGVNLVIGGIIINRINKLINKN